MLRNQIIARSFISFIVISSLNLNTVSIRANDLVPTDDLTGGTSVFVFRESSKRPQAGGGSASAFRAAGGSPAARRARVQSQIASARKRKADAAKVRAAELAKARARERNARLRLSNTLTAKGEAALDAGDSTGAVMNFREALKANPQNTEATAGLSEALTLDGIEAAGTALNESALPILAEAVKLDPKNEIAFAKMGEIHDARGRNAEAILNFEKALALDPGFTSLYLPLGLAYAEANKLVEAETYLTKAEAAGIDSGESRMARISIFVRQSRFPEALALLERVAQAEPANGAVHFQRAALYGRLNQPENAFAAYQRAVNVQPDLAAAWFELGVIYYNRGDYANALDAYLRATKAEPENYAAQANLASTYRQLERYAEANAAYRAAEPGNTKNPDHYSEWGFCLGKTNEWDKSIVRLNTARELSPNAVDNTNLGWAYYNAARQDKEAGREVEARQKLELARQYLQMAVSLDPKLDAAYLNLGSTNNSLGDHQAAVEALNVALTLRRDWVIAMNQLGIGYRGLSNFAMAIELFKRVTMLDANNVFGLYSLGEVYHLSGNKKEARKVQAQLKRINPAFASKLDGVFSGKAAADETRRKIESKVPRVPRIPF
jgi:superkiller protein 3